MKKFSSITRVNSHRISQNKKLARIVLITSLCIVLLFLVPKIFNALVATIAAPVNMTKSWIIHSGNSLPQYFRNRSILIDNIASLQSEISAGSGDKYTADILAKENKELRTLLGDHGQERTLAGVIGRAGTLPYDSLMLDQGSQDGILVGAPVYIGGNTVIGLVKNATAHTSLVELITTDGFETTVYIMGPDIYTNAVGMGGGQLRVGVPQGILMSVGDIVILPSIQSGVYGEINVIQSEPSRPEQYGYVSPNIPMSSIRLVSVGKTPLHGITFQDAQDILSSIKTDVFKVPVPDRILVGTTTEGAIISTSSPLE